MSFSIAAAEPWPENATLYQPLKGKWFKKLFISYTFRINSLQLQKMSNETHIIIIFFTEDQILLSDSASSLAVQVKSSALITLQFTH